MKTELVNLSQVIINEANPRTITQTKLDLLIERLLAFPKMIDLRPIVVDSSMVVLGGNMRVRALNIIAQKSIEEIKAILNNTKDYQSLTDAEKENLISKWQLWLDKPLATIARADQLTDAEKKQFIIADNASFGQWDYDMLANEWDSADLTNWGVDVWDIDPTKDDEEEDAIGKGNDDLKGSLNDRFVVPPFSILDTRRGYWQERKKIWRNYIGDLGESREGILFKSPEMQYPDLYSRTQEKRKALGISFREYLEKYVPTEIKAKEDTKVISKGVSVFDPVLAEVLCRWFTPFKGAKIFDCFAGDTQKGLVFGKCGYAFKGVELRQEQVDVNNRIIADRNLPISYICDDGQNVAKYFEPNSQDLLFSCPPYFDLEVYSNLDNDASNQKSYSDFIAILHNAFINAI